MAKADSRRRIATAIRWASRVWGTLILAFVLIFLIASSFGEWGEGLRDFRELFVFAMFPCSTVVGLSIALWREGPGGLITTTGMRVAFMLRPDLIGNPFFSIGVLVPGISYLTYWALTRNGGASPYPERRGPA